MKEWSVAPVKTSLRCMRGVRQDAETNDILPQAEARGFPMTDKRYTTVGEFVITGKQMDDHSMGELEDRIWENLERLQDALDEHYSCADHWNSVTQGDMHKSELRVRVILESAAERFDDE